MVIFIFFPESVSELKNWEVTCQKRNTKKIRTSPGVPAIYTRYQENDTPGNIFKCLFPSFLPHSRFSWSRISTKKIFGNFEMSYFRNKNFQNLVSLFEISDFTSRYFCFFLTSWSGIFHQFRKQIRNYWSVSIISDTHFFTRMWRHPLNQ